MSHEQEYLQPVYTFAAALENIPGVIDAKVDDWTTLDTNPFTADVTVFVSTAPEMAGKMTKVLQSKAKQISMNFEGIKSIKVISPRMDFPSDFKGQGRDPYKDIPYKLNIAFQTEAIYDHSGYLKDELARSLVESIKGLFQRHGIDIRKVDLRESEAQFRVSGEDDLGVVEVEGDLEDHRLVLNILGQGEDIYITTEWWLPGREEVQNEVRATFNEGKDLHEIIEVVKDHLERISVNAKLAREWGRTIG